MRIDLAALRPWRAIVDVAVQLIGRAANLGLGVVATVVIVRALGDRGYGRWSTVFVVVQLAGYFASLGFEMIAVRQAAAEPDREAHWVGALVSLRLALALPTTIAAAVIVAFLSHGSEMRIAGLVLSALLLVGAPTSLRAVFQLRVRNDMAIFVMTINSILWTGAVIGIAVAGGGLVAFALAFLAVASLTAALQALLVLRAVPIRFRGSRRLWRPLIALGIPTGIAGALALAYGRIDQVLVFELAGARQAGLYSAVYRILDQAQFVPIAVTTTLFPILAASHTTSVARMRRLFELSAKFLALVSLPALALAIVESRTIVQWLFGARFAAGGDALPVLMGAFVVICFGYLAGTLIVVLNLQRKLIGYALIALVVNAGLNLIFVPRYGFLAAAWITLVTEVIVVSLQLHAVMRETGAKLPLSGLAPVAMAAAVMGICAWALAHTGIAALWTVLAATAIYGVALIASGALQTRDVTVLLGREPAL